MLPSLHTIEQAAQTVYQQYTPTPTISWPLLNEALGTQVWVKHENHGPVGAFKLRGGLVYIKNLKEQRPHIKAVVSATRGNHGQSLATAGRLHGVDVTIVVPQGNSKEKNAAMRAQGATLIEHGAEFQESREYAATLANDNTEMVPSFHLDLVAGVATYWLEFFKAQPDLDVVLVPVGMGSGVCAAVAARNALGLDTKIIGVVSAHALAYKISFETKQAQSSPVTTVLADGMACRTPDPQALTIMLENVDRVVAVTDDEVAQAMRLYFKATHNVAEGAGAAPLAAALQLKHELAGLRVGLPLCGGNVDADVFASVLNS